MKKRYLVASIILVIIAIAIVMAYKTNEVPDIGQSTNYFCDVKILTLKTDIEVKKQPDLTTVAYITGNLFSFVTDPLTMYDIQGNKIAYGSDEYHFISQDSHLILVNNLPTVEMVGKFSIPGDKYDIYDVDGHLIAKAEFNFLNTYGKVVGTDGLLWADYNSNVFRLDYTVRIKDNCKVDTTTMLMMMASFYSDRKADSNNNSKKNQ